MCGRYACAVNNMGRWGRIFKVWLEDIPKRYNIPPGSTIPVFLDQRWKMMKWGLIPAWSKEGKMKYATFNARRETLVDKPAYQNSWKKKQRCLIPLTGYYEWRNGKGGKKPYYIHSSRDELLVVGGLWERWKDQESELLSCTIITGPAMGDLVRLHHRMPFFLEPEEAEDWLKGDLDVAMRLLEREATVQVEYHEVDARVGSTRSQGEELILPYRTV